jgi:hypothetical protein
MQKPLLEHAAQETEIATFKMKPNRAAAGPRAAEAERAKKNQSGLAIQL